MSANLMSVTDAAALTARFRSQNQGVLATGMQNTDLLPQCESFDRSAFDTLLGDPNCKGIRIYLGMDINDKVRLIIAGVDGNNEDLFIDSTNPENDMGVDCVIEDGLRCPTTCPPPSPLNS